jgi:hypothetical protein
MLSVVSSVSKQSQFPGGAGRGEAPGAWDADQLRKTNPIWPGLGKAPMRGGCETNPIPGYAGWDGVWGTWDDGKIVQNEPNFPAGPGDTPSPLNPPPGRIVRNKPNFPADGMPHHTGMPSFQGPRHRPFVRNKPNSEWRETEGKCFMEKGLRPIGWAQGLGKTKPISVRGTAGPRLPIADCAKQTQFGLAPRLRQAKCTKRTQLAAGRQGFGETKPISPGCPGMGAGRRRAKDAKRTQFAGCRAGATGPVVRNKANFRLSGQMLGFPNAKDRVWGPFTSFSMTNVHGAPTKRSHTARPATVKKRLRRRRWCRRIPRLDWGF